MTDAIDKAFADFESDDKSHSNIDSVFNQFDTQKAPSILTPTSTAPIPGADTEADYARTKQFQNEQGTFGNFAKDVRETYTKNVGKRFEESQKAASEAPADIAQGLSATGFGKGVFGTFGMPLSLVTGGYDTAGEIAGRLTGNEAFGKKAADLPFMGLPIAKGTASFKSALPVQHSLDIITNSIGKDKLPEVVKRMEDNPRLTVMDVSNPTLMRAEGLAIEPGKHQNTMESFVDAQRRTARSTVEDAYSELGKPVNVKEKLDQLKANAREVGQKQINPAIADAKPVDLTDVLSHIQNKVKPGINSIISAGETLPSTAVQNRLSEIKNYISNDKSIMTDPQRLHQIQSALRIDAERLLGSSVGSEHTLGREIMNVRGKIVDAIDEASGGKYRPALSNFRDEKQIEDAFHKGMDITSNRKGQFEDLPEFWDAWINDAKPSEIEAAKEGALTELRRQRGVARNASMKGETVPQIEFNKEKLSLLFGKKETERMARKLQDEHDIANRNSRLYNSTKTAETTRANEEVKLSKPHPNALGLLPPAIIEAGSIAYSGQYGLGLGAYTAGKGTVWAVNKLKNALEKGRNNELANLMTATGEERQAMLEHFKRKITEGQNQTSLLSREGVASRINALSRVIAP